MAHVSAPRRRKDRHGTWYVENIWEEADQANRDVLNAYREHGRQRPEGPILEMDEADWARLRPDCLAPFWCPCGGVWHVRRHYEAHQCESRKRERAA